MKQFIATLGIFFFTITSFAQLTEGHVIYDVDVSSDNPDMQMAVNMMAGMTMEIYFKDKQSRSEVNMGAMMSITTITNSDSDEMIMLMSGMMGKKAVSTSLSEMQEGQEEKEEDLIIELLDETKEIAGYECKKAIISTSNGEDMTYWYTEEIVTDIQGNQFMNSKVPGFAMGIEIAADGMTMEFFVSKLEVEINNPDDLFEMKIPDGYETMSFDDLQNMGN